MAGVALNDRALGARVRRLTLKEIEKILLGDDDLYKKEIIMKLAPSILPRINEHSGGEGKDGEVKPILVKFIDGSSTDNRDTSGVQEAIR